MTNQAEAWESLLLDTINNFNINVMKIPLEFGFSKTNKFRGALLR